MWSKSELVAGRPSVLLGGATLIAVNDPFDMAIHMGDVILFVTMIFMLGCAVLVLANEDKPRGRAVGVAILSLLTCMLLGAISWMSAHAKRDIVNDTAVFLKHTEALAANGYTNQVVRRLWAMRAGIANACSARSELSKLRISLKMINAGYHDRLQVEESLRAMHPGVLSGELVEMPYYEGP